MGVPGTGSEETSPLRGHRQDWSESKVHLLTCTYRKPVIELTCRYSEYLLNLHSLRYIHTACSLWCPRRMCSEGTAYLCCSIKAPCWGPWPIVKSSRHSQSDGRRTRTQEADGSTFSSDSAPSTFHHSWTFIFIKRTCLFTFSILDWQLVQLRLDPIFNAFCSVFFTWFSCVFCRRRLYKTLPKMHVHVFNINFWCISIEVYGEQNHTASQVAPVLSPKLHHSCATLMWTSTIEINVIFIVMRFHVTQVASEITLVCTRPYKCCSQI